VNDHTARIPAVRILVVEDEADAREFMAMAFKCEGYEVEVAEDGDEAVEIISERIAEFSAVFLDLLMPRKDGLTALREIRVISKDLPVFVTSFATSLVNVVDAIKAGATDFIAKPLSHEILRDHMLQIAVPRLPASNAPDSADGAGQNFWGNGRRMREIQTTIRRISESEAPVLIEGETGSGKEVLAREIHAHSPRAGRPFLKLNCAALPSELVESELFGYERGAFTGAFQRKAGMFELADRGTILLDEIGDMDYKLQAKLLQVLQDCEFQRLGGKETVHVDVRVMAATHRDLHKAIQNETFREDLYYRLNVINVHIPPLRERREDILPLAHRLMQKHAGNTTPPPLSPAVQQAMLQYVWPGNVRELENLIRRFLILRDQSEMLRELGTRSLRATEAGVATRDASAPEAARRKAAALAASAEAYADSDDDAPVEPAAPARVEHRSVLMKVARAKEEAEAAAILDVLERTHWNRKRAAQVLNIDYKALLYKMKKLDIGANPPERQGAKAASLAAGADSSKVS
jgi:two-component system, NtrC family, response regulator AtoC